METITFVLVAITGILMYVGSVLWKGASKEQISREKDNVNSFVIIALAVALIIIAVWIFG